MLIEYTHTIWSDCLIYSSCCSYYTDVDVQIEKFTKSRNSFFCLAFTHVIKRRWADRAKAMCARVAYRSDVTTLIGVDSFLNVSALILLSHHTLWIQLFALFLFVWGGKNGQTTHLWFAFLPASWFYYEINNSKWNFAVEVLRRLFSWNCLLNKTLVNVLGNGFFSSHRYSKVIERETIITTFIN